MLSDAQIKEIMDDVSGGNPDRYFAYTSTTIELCRAIEAAVREELADAIRLNEEYDAVLRGLAIHVGAGGFNDQPTLIDPMIAEEKIIWGINHILEIEQKRHAKQEPVAWKQIAGYENRYEVSSDGHVRNIQTGKVLAKNLAGCGYVKADLWKDGERWQTTVHRLVAGAFIDNPEDLPEVNHINGNKTDNRVCNLEWVTRASNVNHSYYVLGNQINSVIATNTQNGEKIYYQSIEAAVRDGFNSGSIYHCLSGRYKSTRGFRFEVAAPVVQPDDLKDAARYRMLRNGEYWPAAFYDHDEPEPLRGQELDAAIDAVMAAEKAQK